MASKLIRAVKKKLRAPAPVVRERAKAVGVRLEAENPDPHVELKFDNPWQLLIAVILSAQSTDKMVNKVMPDLLARWPTPKALAKADQADVETVIKSTGFFRNKAKSIRGASQMIVERHQGLVPRTMEEMLEVPGVARKTANVVLGAAYAIPSGIAVDTHAMRVSQRLKLTKQKLPEKIEADLCALFPPEEWIRMGHRLVLHGRYVCLARSPQCERCPLNEICPSHEKEPERSWKDRAEGVRREMQSRALPFTLAQPRP
jgi:endonuclease III